MDANTFVKEVRKIVIDMKDAEDGFEDAFFNIETLLKEVK